MGHTLIWAVIMLIYMGRSTSAVNYINFVVDSVRSEETNLACDLKLYDEILANTIANISFDCSPGIEYHKHQLKLNGTLTYPIVFLLSIKDSETNKEVHHAYSSLNTLENAPNYMKHRISKQKFTMIYNTSLQCEDGFVGRHCNISCEAPQITDHYVCSRDGKVCNKGWLGVNCDQPYCQSNCSRHGKCVSPGVCECHAGWIGRNCEECVRREGCVYGYCSQIPYSCKCKLGYSGSLCDRHFSSECILSDCVHGQCAFIRSQKVCHCDAGYHGLSCNYTIPKTLPPTSSMMPPYNQMAHQYWHPPPPPPQDSVITLNTLLLLASFTCLFCSILLFIQRTYKYIQNSRTAQNPPVEPRQTFDEAKFFTASTPPPPYPVDNPKLLC